jgi:NAD(P)-dependent dehydrogenase (short-subunit alcohol dehydrogenase family)
VSHAFASVGAKVYCIDKHESLAHDVAAEIGGVAGCGDIVNRADAERLFAEAETSLGSINAVVDIVGVARFERLLEVDDASWDWHHDIVLRHAFYALQLGGPAISRAGGGSLSFVASVSGMTGAAHHAAYGAAKAGLMSLVRSAAVELGPSAVRVNAVAPGVVWTPRLAAHLGEQERQPYAQNAPLGRVGTPSDIASVLLFLASDLAAYVTGQTVVVDGGVNAKFPYPVQNAD